MPSKKQYDLVLEDGLDSKTSLYSEDSFQQGINFQAKVCSCEVIVMEISLNQLIIFASKFILNEQDVIVYYCYWE